MTADPRHYTCNSPPLAPRRFVVSSLRPPRSFAPPVVPHRPSFAGRSPCRPPAWFLSGLRLVVPPLFSLFSFHFSLRRRLRRPLRPVPPFRRFAPIWRISVFASEFKTMATCLGFGALEAAKRQQHARPRPGESREAATEYSRGWSETKPPVRSSEGTQARNGRQKPAGIARPPPPAHPPAARFRRASGAWAKISPTLPQTSIPAQEPQVSTPLATAHCRTGQRCSQ